MRIERTLPILLAGAALLLAPAPVSAHHAMIAQYALDKPITLKGTLTKVEWKNPHGLIYLDVKASDGRVENWAIETGSVAIMAKRGPKAHRFSPGSEIIIGGWVAKDGTRNAAGWIITFPDREAASRGGEASFSLGR